MSTEVTSEFMSDGFFIISDTVELGNENDGTLGGTQVPIGLSKVPNLQENRVSVVSNDYGIEKIQPAYNPDFKEDACVFTTYDGGRWCQIKKYKYDTREHENTGLKIPVQRKSKIGDDHGRLGRHVREFSRKQQKHMRFELCKLNIQMMPYSPLWIDLTTTPYIYKLRKTGITNAVSDFCKGGLKRWRERLRDHDQMKHLTGMYKWEFTKSELPHLHLLAWFDKWTGDSNLKEHQFIDLDWFARSWFESLFPTKELQDENIKHLEAGTRVEKVRGYSKKHAQRKMIKKVEAYPKERFEQDKSAIDPRLEVDEDGNFRKDEKLEVDEDGKLLGMSEREFTDALKLEGKGGAWEKVGNYLTKYITKEDQDIPDGWGNSHFHGLINRNAFKSYQRKIWFAVKPEEREAIHTAMVQIDNERIVNHVRLSKTLEYLIKRVEKRVYVKKVDGVGICLDGTDDLLDDQNDYHLRTFHHKWIPTLQPEELIDENGNRKKDSYGCPLEIKRYYDMVLYDDEDYLDDEGQPKQYVLEFFDHVYDTDGNFIGVYEQTESKVKVLETDGLTHDETWEDPDGIMRTTRRFTDPVQDLSNFLAGIDVDGFQTKRQFILINKHGGILETHDNWKDIRGRKILNEDEHRYINTKSMYGVDYREVLIRAFPDHSFTIDNYSVSRTSIDKQKLYFKEEIELCLSIRRLLTIEQEPQVMQLQAS